jgi:methionine synthase II (cobalamin-independent)
MPIEPVEIPKTEEEKAQENKPLLNIQLPAPMSGDPNAPLSVGRHNASAQHNFQQIANILLTIINNQKLMGMAITEHDKQARELKENLEKISENIRELLKENENDKPEPSTTNK